MPMLVDQPDEIVSFATQPPDDQIRVPYEPHVHMVARDEVEPESGLQLGKCNALFYLLDACSVKRILAWLQAQHLCAPFLGLLLIRSLPLVA